MAKCGQTVNWRAWRARILGLVAMVCDDLAVPFYVPLWVHDALGVGPAPRWVILTVVRGAGPLHSAGIWLRSLDLRGRDA